MKRSLSMILMGAALLTQPVARAGVVEDLLAVPAIQSLLRRLPELAPLVKRCEDAAYRQRNQALCQQAEQAAQLAKMPAELRSVMSHAPSAKSLRELCVAAVGGSAQHSYLCAELYKYDATFKAQVIQRQQVPVQQEDFMNRQMR